MPLSTSSDPNIHDNRGSRAPQDNPRESVHPWADPFEKTPDPLDIVRRRTAELPVQGWSDGYDREPFPIASAEADTIEALLAVPFSDEQLGLVPTSRVIPSSSSPSFGDVSRDLGTRKCNSPLRKVLKHRESGDMVVGMFLCQRWSCPDCRQWMSDELTARITDGFDSDEMWETTVPEEDWGRIRRRLSRSGVEYVRLPAPAETWTLLTTSPVDDDSLEVDDREGQVATAVAARPLRHDVKMSSSRGFLAAASKPAAQQTYTFEGYFHDSLDLEDIAERAEAEGIQAVPVEADRAHGWMEALRLKAEWDSEEAERFRAAIGFMFVDRSEAVSEDWIVDESDGDWDALAVYAEGSA